MYDYMIYWLKQILLIIWQLPQILIALIMLPFLGTKKLIKYEKFCWTYECEKMLGAISLGCFIFLSPHSAKKETTIAHELDGHVKQSHILGWLFLIVIGLPSITWAGIYKKLGFKNYYWLYTESWANKLAGLGVDSCYRLYFLKKPKYKTKKYDSIIG